MPNALAYVVFYAWPLVTWALFRRQPVVPALVWSMVLGYILLPYQIQIDPPVIPAIGKHEMISLSAALMCWISHLQQRRTQPRGAAGAGLAARGPGSARPRKSRIRILLWLFLAMAALGPVGTAMTNTDTLFFGPLIIPALRLYDAFSMAGLVALTLLPFWLGMKVLTDAAAQKTLLRILGLSMCAYAFLALWEVRMSPQLNVQIYGFFAHSFAQHIRAGGFRPLVFFSHGLQLGIFLAMAVLAAAMCWRLARASAGRAASWGLAVLWLVFALFMAKTLGAFMIALALLPVALLLGVRAQLLVAAGLAGMVLLYPMLRGADLVPTEAVYEYVAARDVERSLSFRFRLDNEEALLARAAERPVFGWGTWGRNLIFDPETGEELSVTDGVWIIVIGAYGWVSYLAWFGLLTVPTILMALRRKVLGVDLAAAGVALVLAANLVDLLPNSALSPITWLIAGSVMGRYISAREGTSAPDGAELGPETAPAAADTAPPRKLHTRRPRGAPATGGPARG